MIIDKQEFCEKIEHRYANCLVNENSIIDIVVDVCSEYNIDPELAKPLLNRSLIEKIEHEAIKFNMIKTKRNTHELSEYI